MKEITWKEVYQSWEEREVAIWKEVWEEKGCTSWKQWRAGYIHALRLTRWKWYEMEASYGEQEFFEDCFASPLTRWRDFSSPPATFSEMERHPFLVVHGRIKEIQKSLPLQEEMTVIVLTDDSIDHDVQCLQSYITGQEIQSEQKKDFYSPTLSRFDRSCHFDFLMVDGHHRAMAIALLPEHAGVYPRIIVHVARVPGRFFHALCFNSYMFYTRRLLDAMYRYNILRP